MYEYIYLTHGSVNVVKNAIVPMIYNFKAIKKIPTDFSQEECGKWPTNFNIFMEIQRSKIRSRNAKFPILLEMKTCTATVILRVTWPVAGHIEWGMDLRTRSHTFHGPLIYGDGGKSWKKHCLRWDVRKQKFSQWTINHGWPLNFIIH